MKCDSCHQEVYGVSILGIMPWDRIKDREPARICMDCHDTCPCGFKGYWYDGLLTCKHGYVYDVDYFWDGEIAQQVFNLKKRKWWSYFIISNNKHQASNKLI